MSKSIPIDEVLIVDDDVISLFAQEQLLQSLDITKRITAIEDGEEAINFIKNNWIAGSSKEEPEEGKKLLLLDFRMPKMSGMELLEQLAQLDNTDNIAIVVLSSIMPDFIRKNSNAFNVIGCIDKPLTKEKVEQILDNI